MFRHYLEGKRFCIFGLQDSGKTCLAKKITEEFHKHIVFDVMNEYGGLPKFNRYVVSANARQGMPLQQEFELFANNIDFNKLDLLILDECNRIAPNRQTMPPRLTYLNDSTAHYGMAMGIVARRPSQLHTDLVELAHYVFCFGLGGKNDIQYLNDTCMGLGDKVSTLPLYHYIVYHKGSRAMVEKKPIDIKKFTITKGHNI